MTGRDRRVAGSCRRRSPKAIRRGGILAARLTSSRLGDVGGAPASSSPGGVHIICPGHLSRRPLAGSGALARLPVSAPRSTTRLLDRDPAEGAVTLALQEGTAARGFRYTNLSACSQSESHGLYAPDRRARRAARIAAAMQEKPDVVLGLPTAGRRSRSSGAGRLTAARGLDWSASRLQLDEFVGAPVSAASTGVHAGHLFRHTTGGRSASTSRRTADPGAESGVRALFSPPTDRHPDNGHWHHVHIVQRRAELQARTHLVTRPRKAPRNAGSSAGNAALVPVRACRWEWRDSEARALILLANGESKGCVERVAGPITTALPASFFPPSADADLIHSIARPRVLTARPRLLKLFLEHARSLVRCLPDGVAHEVVGVLQALERCGSVRFAFCMTIAALTFHWPASAGVGGAESSR